MSCVAVRLQRAREQKAIVEAIEKAGGRVWYEPTWLSKTLRDESFIDVTTVSSSTAEDSDAVMAQLNGLSQIKELNFGGSHLTGLGVAHIKGLTQLRSADLSDTKVRMRDGLSGRSDRT